MLSSEAFAGQAVVLALESSEALVSPPDVTVDGNPASAAKTAYGFEYTVEETDPLGPALIEISDIDSVGNPGAFSDSTSLLIVAEMPVSAWPAAFVELAGGAMLCRKRKE